MRSPFRFAPGLLALAASLAFGCGSEPSESTAPAAGDTEAEAPPAQSCRSMSTLREALDLGDARVERTEIELTGEAPAELILWYGEDDPGAPNDDMPSGAKRGRLLVVDCSGDAPRSIGERTYGYVHDPDTRLQAASRPGLRTRPVAAGDRTFLRVDVTSLAARVFSERVSFLEVHDDALREVFACETARDVRSDEGRTVVGRQVQLVGDGEGPRIHVRRQRDEGAIDEADYAWSDGSFTPSGEDLCAGEG